MFGRREPADSDGWTSGASSSLALAGFLAIVLVAFTLLAMGPLAKFDAYFNLQPPPAGWVPVLHVLDRVGQRAVALPVLGLALWYVYRRTRSWRPVAVAVASVVALNALVLVLKVGLGRSFPHTADPTFFSGGMAYPSGHAANIVLVYGLATYVVSRYTAPPARMRILMGSAVAVLGVVMVVTSLTLDWHWFADLVAGLLVGGIVLELTVAGDRLLPRDFLAPGGERAPGGDQAPAEGS